MNIVWVIIKTQPYKSGRKREREEERDEERDRDRDRDLPFGKGQSMHTKDF